MNTIGKAIRSFGNWLFSEWDTAIALAVSAAAGIYGVFTGDSYLLSAIASVLAILSIGLLRDRRARRQIEVLLHDLRSRPRADDFIFDRTRYTSFSELVGAAQHVCLLGPSLVNLFSQWADFLADSKIGAHNASIEAVILDPEGQGVQQASECLGLGVSDLRHEIEGTLRQAQIMSQRLGTKAGNISILLSEASTNLSLVLIDPDRASGIVIVELIGYKSALHMRPHFVLTKSQDERWFNYFVDQYRSIARHSRPADLKANSTHSTRA